jgi:hypothetical protein
MLSLEQGKEVVKFTECGVLNHVQNILKVKSALFGRFLDIDFVNVAQNQKSVNLLPALDLIKLRLICVVYELTSLGFFDRRT